MANSIKWQYQISEFTGGSKLCRFFENVEQFLSAICAVTLRAADLLNNAQLLQLSDGAHHRVIRQTKALFCPARSDEWIRANHLHHLESDLSARIASKLFAPTCQ